MATKTRPILLDFSSGEFSPKMGGRIDLDRYQRSGEKIRNWICFPQGGIATRGGFRFAAQTKFPWLPSRLIPFSRSNIKNYMIEAGWKYFRFFDSDVGEALGYEIATPYDTVDNIMLIRWAQTGSSMYLVHPEYPVQLLQWNDEIDFSITEVEFIDGPYMKQQTTYKINPTGVIGDIELDADGEIFYEGHVGSLWRLKHGDTWGYVKITAVDSLTHAFATVKKELGGDGPSDAYREGAWSGVRGYPRCVCFHEQRLLFANNDENPTKIWASKMAEYTNFTEGSLDDDPWTYNVSEITSILWMVSSRVLCVGGSNVEVTARGPTGEPISPTSPPDIHSETPYGSSLVSPVKAGNVILFPQRSGRRIRELLYKAEDDGYSAGDISIFADHLFEADIVDMTYGMDPVPLLWVAKSDGSLAGCTYDKSLGVFGWHSHDGDGKLKSVAVNRPEAIPSGEEEGMESLQVNGLSVAVKDWGYEFVYFASNYWSPPSPDYDAIVAINTEGFSIWGCMKPNRDYNCGIMFFDGYLYFGTGSQEAAQPRVVEKIDPSMFAKVGKLDVASWGIAAALNMDWDYIYCMTRGSGTKTLLKIHPPTFAVVDTLDMYDTFEHWDLKIPSVLGMEGEESFYLMFGSPLHTGSLRVYKVDLSAWSYQEIGLTAGSTSLHSAVYEAMTGYSYWGAVITGAARIHRVDGAAGVELDYLDIPDVNGTLEYAVIDEDNGYAYFGTAGSPAQILKIELSSFTLADTLELDEGDNVLSCAAIDVDLGFIYFGTKTTPARVIKVDLSTFTKVDSIILGEE